MAAEICRAVAFLRASCLCSTRWLLKVIDEYNKSQGYATQFCENSRGLQMLVRQNGMVADESTSGI